MILVTGASGFIGSHVAETLLARGEKLRCLLRRSSSRRYVPPADLVYADLLTGEGVEESLDGIDLVIHVAGLTKALRAKDFYSGNSLSTSTLARACGERRIRFIHVSSLAAVGPSSGGIPVSEATEPRPLTHYGRSKLEAEHAVRALSPEAVIVRPPVVYGPRDTGVLQVLRPVSRGLAIDISGGERWFSAIFVKDLVEGLIAIAGRKDIAGRTYFLSHPKPVSWSELAGSAAAVMGRRLRVLHIPPGAAMALGYGAELWAHLSGKPGILSREKVAEAQCGSWICDSRLAAQEFGFQARTPLREGLIETLAWYREASWLHY